MASLGFDIFARDHASRTFKDVGDEADSLGRRINSVNRDSASLGSHFSSLGGTLSGLSGHFGSLTGQIGSVGVSIVGTSARLATFAAAAASAASTVGGLVAALAPAAGIVAALPGAVALAQGAMLTLKVAVIGVSEAFGAALGGDAKKFEEAIKDLAPAAQSVARELQGMRQPLLDIKNTVQQALFEPLQGELTRLVDTLGGPVRDGMAGVAREFGLAGLQASEFARSADSVAAVRSIFSDLQSSIAGLRPAMGPLLAGFRDLAVVGSGFASGLTPGIAGAATRFGEFLSKASASGQALQWMQNALEVFKQLGAIAKDVGGILGGIFDAMKKAGGGALGVLGQLADGLNKFVNSAKGQAALVEIFTALRDIGQAFMPVLGALVSGIGSIAPVVADLAEAIGPILTDAINAVAPALKALGPGVIAVFQALGDAVEELASSGALTDIASALADVMVATAPLLPALADVLVPTLQFLAGLITSYVAPAIETLVGWIQKAIDWIQGGAGLTENSWIVRLATTIRDAVLPVWNLMGEVIGKVISDIVTWVQNNQGTISQWGERIISIVKSVGEIVAGVWQFISFAWDQWGGPLLDHVGNIFSGILQVIDGALTFIKGIVNTVMGLITGDWDRAWGGVKQIFSGVWEAIKGVLGIAVSALQFQLSNLMNVLGQLWTRGWNGISSFFSQVWENIVKAIGSMKDNAVRHFQDLVSWVRGIPGQIVGALGNLGGLLYNSGRSIIQGLIDGLYSMLQAAYNAAADILNRIRSLFPSSPAKEGPFSGKGWTLFSGMSLAEGFAEGMLKGRSLVGSAAEGLAGAASFGVSTAVTPVMPAGGVGGGVTNVFQISFAGQPLVGRDEIFRVFQEAVEDAARRGFPLGTIGGTS